MKLQNFKATAVHGYYNFDIDFFQDLNFVVGINGTGKTTALRLIQAVLTCNVRDLLTISFKKIELVIEHNQKLLEITIRKETEIVISLSSEKEKISFPAFSNVELDEYLKAGRLNDYAEELRFKLFLENSPIINFFRTVQKPIFLGLDRRFSKEDIDIYDIEETRSAPRLRNLHAGIRSAESIQVDGLENSKLLIKNAYRKFRQFSDRQSGKFVDIIVKSAFKYMTFADLNLNDVNKSEAYVEYQNILARRNEIESLAKTFGDEKIILSQIKSFYDQLESAYKRMDANDDGINIEWLLNKAQVGRIAEILKEMDSQKKRASVLYVPIQSFTDTANFFFEQSRKHVSVDSVGSLIITLNNQIIPPASLSSGERQLLILLAHVIFMPRKESDVIIIDEPELSLHLKWQENLVQKLVDLNSLKQLIFATHSPEIIGYRKEKAVRVSK